MDEHEEGPYDLNKALAEQPDDPDTLYFLSAAHAQLGERDAGLERLKAAVEANPDAREWAKEDEAFADLRTDPDFRVLAGLNRWSKN